MYYKCYVKGEPWRTNNGIFRGTCVTLYLWSVTIMFFCRTDGAREPQVSVLCQSHQLEKQRGSLPWLSHAVNLQIVNSTEIWAPPQSLWGEPPLKYGETFYWHKWTSQTRQVIQTLIFMPNKTQFCYLNIQAW